MKNTQKNREILMDAATEASQSMQACWTMLKDFKPSQLASKHGPDSLACCLLTAREDAICLLGRLNTIIGE